LDDINELLIPIKEIENLKQESSKIGIDFHTYRKWGEDWVACRSPKLNEEDRKAKLSEYYGLGARKRRLFERLNAIKSGIVPVKDIGKLKEESELVDIHFQTYEEWGKEWIAITFPEILPENRLSELSNYFGLGARKKALFARLDLIDAGLLPIKDIGYLP
jgi:hypothetical protein